jgi:GxxExxY protein
LLLLAAMLDTTPFDAITSGIIAAAIEVHRHLGPGLLESTYLDCLTAELTDRRLRWASQRVIPVVYKGRALNTTYRVDLLVEDVIVVELKALEHVLPVHGAQVLTYMRLTNAPLGLLINFNVPKLVTGVKRFVNPYYR